MPPKYVSLWDYGGSLFYALLATLMTLEYGWLQLNEEFQDDHPVRAKKSQIKEFSHKRKKSFYSVGRQQKKKTRKEFYCLKERRTNDFHTNIFVEYILLFVGYSSNSCEGDNTNSTEKYF